MSTFVFERGRKVSHVWNGLRVSAWWQSFHSCVDYPFNYYLLQFCSMKKRTAYWLEQCWVSKSWHDFLQELAISIKFGLFDIVFFPEVTVFLYFSILLHIFLNPKVWHSAKFLCTRSLSVESLKKKKKESNDLELSQVCDCSSLMFFLCTTSALFRSCVWQTFMASAEAVGGGVFISFLT